MKYFDSKSTAERYAKGRPAFHHNTIKHIREFLQIGGKLENALDVACGTGLSTIALLDIAENAQGINMAQNRLQKVMMKKN